jgi:hypothetical protein
MKGFCFLSRLAAVVPPGKASPNAGRFSCETRAPLEHHTFTWQRPKGAVTIERISGILEA